MKSVYILLTDRCNLHCKYCFQGPKRVSGAGAKATARVMDGFVAFCARNGVSNAEIFGGEPLLYPDLFRYVVKALRARMPNLHIGVVTNGTLLAEDSMSLIEREGVNVLVSIDGRKERHNAMRGGFERIRRWFPRLAALDSVTVAIQGGRVEGLYSHIRYLWDAGFRQGVFINLIYNYGWYTDRDVRLFEREYENAVLGMLRGEGVLLCAARLYDMLQQAGGYQECGLVGEGLACDWDGILYPCIRAVELGADFAIGEVWAGVDRVKNRVLRNRIRREFLASDSVERYPYVSFCPVEVFQRHGHFGGNWSKQYCEMIQIKAKTVAKYYHELQHHAAVARQSSKSSANKQ